MRLEIITLKNRRQQLACFSPCLSQGLELLWATERNKLLKIKEAALMLVVTNMEWRRVLITKLEKDIRIQVCVAMRISHISQL